MFTYDLSVAKVVTCVKTKVQRPVVVELSTSHTVDAYVRLKNGNEITFFLPVCL